MGRMRTVLETVAVAFSMFSALPMPSVGWTERNMRYALCAFPLIGAVIGGLCFGWSALCQWLSLSPLLRGAVWCLIPVMVTGGIHLDGYADTSDALCSQGDLAKKQEILKDPHVGAFGVIRLCGYFVASFALWSGLPRYAGGVICLSFCLSRALSGLAVATFPLAKSSGLAYTFAAAADKRRVRRVLWALSVLLSGGLCLMGVEGGITALAAWAVFLYYHRMTMLRFGGLSGDLAGWFLQTAELVMLGALCITQYGEAML